MDWDRFQDVALAALVAVLPDFDGRLGPDDHLLDDVGLDSFAVLVFIGELEAGLGRILPPSQDEPTLSNLFALAQRDVQGGDR